MKTIKSRCRSFSKQFQSLVAYQIWNSPLKKLIVSNEYHQHWKVIFKDSNRCKSHFFCHGATKLLWVLFQYCMEVTEEMGSGSRGLRGERGVITTSKETLKNQEQRNLPIYLSFPSLQQNLLPSSPLQKKNQGIKSATLVKQKEYLTVTNLMLRKPDVHYTNI